MKKAMFISPIVDMEKLILGMMEKAGVSEKELCSQKIINTPFDGALSWKDLSISRIRL